MRKVDENRAENFIRRHSNYKKWLAFALCVSLLTGTLTLYMMNKPATAMTEDGAKSVGLVLETADDDFEQDLIEETMDNQDDEDSDEDYEESEDCEDSDEDSDEDSEDSEESDDADDEDSSEADEADSEDSEATEDSSEDASSEMSSAAEEKLLTMNVPDAVDVSEYVTSIVYERKLLDGSWEVIEKEDICEGDWIRITYMYDMPDTAKLSGDIRLSVPDDLEMLNVQKASLLDGSGSAEIIDGSDIKIEYREDIRQEIIDDASEGSDLHASLPARGIFSFFKLLSPLKVHAAGEGLVVEGEALVGASSEAGSTTLDASWINKVDGRYGVKEEWSSNGGFVGFIEGSGQPLTDGAQIPEDTYVYFGIDCTIPAGSLADKHGVKYDTLVYNIKDKLGLIPGQDQWNDLNAAVFSRSEGKRVGTLTISNGIATIKFDEDFVKKNANKEIDADFFFAGKAKKVSDNEDEEKTFYFNDQIQFDVRIVKGKEYDLKIEKTNTGVLGKNSNQVNYTIKVWSDGRDGSGGPITLDDNFSFSNNDAAELFNNAQIKEIKVVRENGKLVGNVNAQKTGTGYTLTLPELKKGESYEITYSYKFDQKIKNFDYDTVVTNTARATTEKFGKVEMPSDFTIEGKLKKETPDIKKVVKGVDKDEKKVTWEIVINEKRVNLKGYTLRDILKTWDKNKAQLLENYKGTATIDPAIKIGGRYTNTITFDGDKGFVFPATNEKYTIIITTPYDEYALVDGKYVYNTVTIDKDNHHNEDKAKTEDIGGDIDKTKKEDKTAEGYTFENGTILFKWKVVASKDITCDRKDEKGNACFEYIDEMSGGQVITDAQLSALKKELDGKGVRYKIETGNEVVLTGEVSVKGYTDFSIFFYDKVNQGFTYSYETTGTVKGGGDPITFKNDSYINSKTFEGSSDSVEYKPMLSKFDGNMLTAGTYNYTDDYLEGEGILTWIIKLEMPGDERANYGTLTIKEHLPDSVTALSEEEGGLAVSTSSDMSGAVSFSGGSASIAGATFSHDSSSQEITFDGDAIKGQTLYFRVKAKINDDEMDGGLWKDGSYKKAFENGAVLLDKDGKEIQWAKETTEINLVGDLVEKDNLKLNDPETMQQEVQYTLEINKGADDLLEGGDVLTLKDTLRASFVKENFDARLKADSIAIYEVNNETKEKTPLDPKEYKIAISDADIILAEGNDYEERYVKYCNIEFSLPDKKHLIIEYTYEFERLEIAGETVDKNNLGSIHVHNVAVLEGVSKGKTSDETDDVIVIYKAGASAEVVGANFAKVDSEDISKLLKGGKFALYKYEAGAGDATADAYGDMNYRPVPLAKLEDDSYKPLEEGEGDNTFTTTAGSCSFTRIQTDVAYRIVELEHPEGYKLGAPIYFVFESKVGSEKTLPENFKEKGGKTLSLGDRIVYTNEKNDTTKILVKKEWINADGSKEPISVKISRRKSHITSTYKYYSVNIYYLKDNKLVEYKGYPSVRDGSTVTYNIPHCLYQATYEKINGSSKEYPGLSGSQSPYAEERSVTVSSDMNIIITQNWGDCPGFSLDPRLSSSGTVSRDDVEGEEDVEELPDTYTLSDENKWMIEINGLPKHYEVEVEEEGVKVKKNYEWLYSVTEVSTNAFYEVSYSDNNDLGINSGTLVITNKRNENISFTLPKTGGFGTLPFACLGLGLTTSAVLGNGIYKRRKKEEDPAD